MRVLSIHLRNASVENVLSFIRENFRREDDIWVYEVGGRSLCYVEFYETARVDLMADFEFVDASQLYKHIGFQPTVDLLVRLSGQNCSKEKAREFACWILERYDGIVFDEFSDHPWTATELRADVTSGRFHFMDAG